MPDEFICNIRLISHIREEMLIALSLSFSLSLTSSQAHSYVHQKSALVELDHRLIFYL